MKERMKVFIITAVMLFVTGCGSGKVAEEYRMVVDDYAEIILPQDQDSYEFDQVLEAVGTYLEDSSPENLKKAENLLLDTTERFQDSLEQSEKRELDEDLKSSLKTCGIATEDYKLSQEIRGIMLSSYCDSMEGLLFYLDAEDSDFPFREELEDIYESDIIMQRANRGSEFCSMNYLFAEWDEKSTAYFQEKIVNQMKSFTADGAVWETDREQIEDKVLAYEKQMEEEISKTASRVGKANEELIQMESEMEECLK